MSDINVRSETLVRALREKGVKVTVSGGPAQVCVTIEQDGQAPEVQLWAAEVNSRTLNRICRRYGLDRQRVFDLDRQMDKLRGLMPLPTPSPAPVDPRTIGPTTWAKMRPSGSDND